MPLETASYVANLDATNPTSTDPKSQGDDHLRMIKSVLQNSFAGFPGMVIVTGSEAQGSTANDYVVTISPSPAGYTASMLVLFKASHANTGAATLKINSLTAKPLLAVDATALKSGDIENGGIVAAYCDGTSFYLVSGNDRANRNGDTYSGTHDFTAATVNVATQTQGDNSTKAASTAYVDAGVAAETSARIAADNAEASARIAADNAEASARIAADNAEASARIAADNAEASARIAADATKAPIDSPAFTGTPTTPTPSLGDNSNKIATTAFVVQQAFQAALPAQPNDGAQYALISQNGVASWGFSTPGFLLMSQGVI
jgi:hypothetical protein